MINTRYDLPCRDWRKFVLCNRRIMERHIYSIVNLYIYITHKCDPSIASEEKNWETFSVYHVKQETQCLNRILESTSRILLTFKIGHALQKRKIIRGKSGSFSISYFKVKMNNNT